MLLRIFQISFRFGASEVESRTQGSMPRTQKNAKAKDRPSRDQGHRRKCSPKKRSSQFFFRAISKKGLQKNFSGEKGLSKFSARFMALFNKISTVQKIVMFSSRGQGSFLGLEASRPRPRTSKCVLEDILKAKDVLVYSTSVVHVINIQVFVKDIIL